MDVYLSTSDRSYDCDENAKPLGARRPHRRWSFARGLPLAGAGLLAIAATLGPHAIAPARAVECADAGAQIVEPTDYNLNTATACGNNANAGVAGSTVIGAGASAQGSNATAVGQSANAPGIDAIAIGSAARVGRVCTADRFDRDRQQLPSDLRRRDRDRQRRRRRPVRRPSHWRECDRHRR